MKIARWGASRNHGVETKAFAKTRAEWHEGGQEIRIRGIERKFDFGSGNSEHFYRVALSAEDFAKCLGILAGNAKTLEEEERKALRKAVPDLVHLTNILATP